MDHLLNQDDGNMRHLSYKNITNSVGKADLIEALLNGLCPEIGKKLTAKQYVRSLL
jgi:hypothetical protein